ncbi:MAG: carboxypeptidase regulatory-like domain-containing protein [Acidobacteriota bacterium]
MLRKPLAVSIAAVSMLLSLACGGGEQAPSAGAEAGAEAPAATAAEEINPATLADAGNITGTIQFTGNAPEMQVIQMAADPYCLSKHQNENVTSQRVVVNANGSLRYVFVYVKEGLEGKTFPVPSEPVEIDQTGCMYAPHMLGIQVGQTLKVVNNDDTLHNVNVQPANNEGFNVGQPIPGMAEERTFQNPEIMIPVKCDVHPWMSAFIGVLDNPYFAVSADDGSFSLDGLPPGDYVIEAWHESFGTQTQNVTVAANQTAEISFTFGS